MTEATPDCTGYSGFHGDIVSLLECARGGAARSINALMAATYWEYQTVLPDELLAEELNKTRRESEARRIARGGDVEGYV